MVLGDFIETNNPRNSLAKTLTARKRLTPGNGSLAAQVRSDQN
jgi:hypothetical protein